MPYKDQNSPAAIASRKRRAHKQYWKNPQKQIARSSKWTKDHKDRVNKNAVIRRSMKLSPEQVLFNNAKQRAKRLELPFNLEVSDLIVPNYCPVLGLPLKVATGHAEPNSPSVDRFDPAKGYVKGNVRVISHKANTIKSNASIEEIKLVLKYMEEGSGTDKRL